MKTKLLVTRKLPQAVERRAAASYDAILNEEDRQYAPAEMVQKAAGMAGILCTVTDDFSAGVIAKLPASVPTRPTC